MIRPRKPLFFAFLPLLLLSAYLALVFQLSLIYVALSLLLAMIGLSALLSALGLRGLAISRSHPREVFAGSPFDVRLTVENRHPGFSSTLFAVEDGPQRAHTSKPDAVVVPSLMPAEQASFTYRLRIDHRGEHRFENARVSSRFPFGMFEKRVTVEAVSTLLVLPRPGRLVRDLIREEPAAMAEMPAPVRGGMGDFHGVRPFQPGDNPRWIHWSTSARKGGHWVREFEREIDRRLLIVFDACPQAAFERAVTMCATLAAHYLRRGYRVALAIVHEKSQWVPFGVDLMPILRALAIVRTVEGVRQLHLDPREVRGAQVAVVGSGAPPGLGAGAVTLVDPSDPALQERPSDASL